MLAVINIGLAVLIARRFIRLHSKRSLFSSLRSNKMIKVQNLHKYFNRNRDNEIHVINDTSLEFPETGLVCLLGHQVAVKQPF